MKAMAILLLVAMMASAALAGLDPASDSFGVYFDTAGNTNCVTASAFQAVPAYLILMNPSGPTNGFECSVTMVGAPHFVLWSNIPCSDLPDPADLPNNYATGCHADYPVTEAGAIVLVTWMLMLQEPSELLFYIGPHRHPSLPGGLPVLTGNAVLRRGAVASGNVNLPVAGINAGNCPVSEEAISFGAVKGLFR